MLTAAYVLAASAWAAQGALVLDANPLQQGQAARLRLVVADGRPKSPPALSVPEGLAIRYSGLQQSFQAKGLNLVQTYTYIYDLQALEVGRFDLGPLDLPLVDGGKVRIPALQVEVQPRQERGPEAAVLSVQAGFLQSEAFEGQVVVYHYWAEARRRIAGVQWTLPNFEGLRQPLKGPTHQKAWVVEEATGPVAYEEGWVPLVATGAGDRSAPAATARFDVLVGRPDFGGFSRTRGEYVSSEKSSLTVRPLPPPPPGFQGLVGEFTFGTRLSRNQAKVGESIDWILEVSGNGTLEGFEPSFPPVTQAAFYPSQAEWNGRIEGGGFSAAGRYEVSLVPGAEGVLELPVMEMVTFSPSEGRYVTQRISAGQLTVRPGSEGAGGMTSFAEAGPADVADAEVGLRGPFRWSWPFRGGPTWPGLVAAGLALLPGGLILAGLGASTAVGELRRRWAQRRPARRPAVTAPLSLAAVEAELSRCAPTDPAQAAEVERLRRALGRALHAGEPLDPAVEAAARALVDAVRSRS